MKNRSHIADSCLLSLLTVAALKSNAVLVSGQCPANFPTFSVVVTGDRTVINHDQFDHGHEASLVSPHPIRQPAFRTEATC